MVRHRNGRVALRRWIRGGGAGLALLVAAGAGVGAAARAQTLARPGWRGSGLHAERWWREPVLFEVRPEAAVSAGPGATALLEQVMGRLGDLQALGVDAVLLRDAGMAAAGAGTAPLDPRYGTVEQFDALLGEASRRRLRVLVETGGSSVGEARFWLSRGVAGLMLRPSPGDARNEVPVLRGVMRGFLGERVLLGEASLSGSGSDGPDLLLAPLRGLAAGTVDAAALRASLDAPVAQRRRSRAGPVAVRSLEVAAEGVAGGGTDGVSAERERAAMAVLLSVRGGVLLPPAALPATAMAEGAPREEDWTARLIGLHRGHATMRRGVRTLLDRDADGALVTVWRGADGPVLVEIVNLRETPLRLSLVEDAARLRLRGTFLRTVLRTDNGMGAMPLRAVALPGFGVYVGQLSR